MEIKFTIEPDIDADDYRELYSAEISMEDGTSFIVKGTETEVSYDQFRSDIFEDLFLSLAEATGVDVNVEENDYAAFDLDDVDDILEDYLADIEPDGC